MGRAASFYSWLFDSASSTLSTFSDYSDALVFEWSTSLSF